jgi:hypothetical protein
MKDYKELSGFVAQRRNPYTDNQNVLYDAHKSQLDPYGGKWVAVCESHSTLCNFRTKKQALKHLRLADWCEECMDLREKKQKKQPKFVTTPVQVLQYHPTDDNVKPVWSHYKKQQIERHGDKYIYFRGPGGGFICKYLFSIGIYAYFEKTKTAGRLYKYFRIFDKNYKRLLGEP